MTASWHVSPVQVDAYVADRIDQVTASSIEAHLLACATCREAVAERGAVPDLAASWARIEALIDDAPGTPGERVGALIGVPSHVVRLLAPTNALRGLWVAAGGAAFLAAALLSRGGFGVPGHLGRVIFLTVAPLIPLAAVSSALGAASEPAAELARTAPISRLWIGALRAGTVLVVTIMCGLLSSTIVPGPWVRAVAWLCPALALTGLAAVLAGRVVSSVAVGVVGAAWVALVTVAAIVTSDGLAAFRAPPQVAYLAVALVAGSVVAANPSHLDLRRIP